VPELGVDGRERRGLDGLKCCPDDHVNGGGVAERGQIYFPASRLSTPAVETWEK
jgi:hypothetical protein